MEELPYKVLNCVDKIEKLSTFGALLELFPLELCHARVVRN